VGFIDTGISHACHFCNKNWAHGKERMCMFI
jgi:hypothetical protein